MYDANIFHVLISVACGAGIGYVVKSWLSTSNMKNQEMEEEMIPGSGDGETKMVLVVQSKLKMGTGKVAAQCAHAAVTAYKYAARSHKTVTHKWMQSGQMKIVVKVNSEEELLDVASLAKKKGLPTYVVSDAGRTQIPRGSKTCLAVGPGYSDLIDEVTGHLKLM